MKLLDLFCCAGGAGMGYHKAGFEVTGVDIGIDMRGQGVIVSAHEHTEKNQGSVGRIDSVRNLRSRTVGVAQEWQAAKPDMRRLPEQGKHESSASFRKESSRLDRRTKPNGLWVCERMDSRVRSDGVHALQERESL